MIDCTTIADLGRALEEASGADGLVVIHIEADRFGGVLGSKSWWDVPVAKTSVEAEVRVRRRAYDRERQAQRTHLAGP